MSIYGTSPEDRARERELNRYLDGSELSEAEELELRMAEVAKRLTRQRSRFGQPCVASQAVFEAISEMDVNQANALTDLMQSGAGSGKWDDAEIGRLVREQVIRYVDDGIELPDPAELRAEARACAAEEHRDRLRDERMWGDAA